ncbi:L-rhamnose mutarotase [Diplonema papillatum]|nr:L-rhamnose mutarotase [Diplonema papillatum]
MPCCAGKMILTHVASAAAGALLCYALTRERAAGQQLTEKGRTAKGNPKAPQRFGGLIKLKKDMYDQYTQLHDTTWVEVLETMYNANMRNFQVYLHEETMQMFSHWEYVGSDLDADMKKVSDSPIIRFWWSYCEPCQEPLHWSGPPPSQGGKGEWWAPLKPLNHCGAWPIAYADEYPDPDFVPCNPSGKTASYVNPPPVHNRKL